MLKKQPYNINQWMQLWNHDLNVASQIISNSDHYVWSYFELTLLRACINDTVYERPREFMHKHNVADMQAWYYLHHLDIGPREDVMDIGCGINPFKEYYPLIVGVDSHNVYDPDLNCEFTEEFARERQGICDKIIAVNSIHFASIFDMEQRIQWVWNMLRPGGRAWIGTNLETWLMHTPAEELTRFEKLADTISFALNEINRWSDRAIVVDESITNDVNGSIRNDLNGNLHLVLQKPTE